MQKIHNANISNLLLVDRTAFENKEEELAPIFEKLVLVDCIPRKKDSFINYTAALCKVERNVAEKAWNTLEKTKLKCGKEKRLAIEKIV